MENSPTIPMPKQVSALNTFWLIEYLREKHRDVDPSEIVESINQKTTYYVENLKTGNLERVAVDHLAETEYWFSNQFMIDLYNEIQSRIPDSDLAYKIGRTSYKAQPILKTAIGAPLLGPQGVVKKIVKENSKYNRTKDTLILKAEKGHIILRLVHKDGIRINHFAMEWHRGVYEAYAKLSGATDVRIQSKCIDYDKAIWDFDIKFKEPSFLSRLLKIFVFNIPIVKDVVEKAEQIQLEQKEQIINRDRIIEEKTKELRETQSKLIESEKRTLEHRITGGFAHEMRNALAGAQLEFRSTLNYKGKGKPSADVLKDATTSLLENISHIHEKYGVPKEEIVNSLIPEIRTLTELSDHLSGILTGVSKDIDRGLSITNQIRNYAKMSELKPGNEPVDLVPLLYERRYKQDFQRIGIRYSVEGIEQAIIKADKSHITSIFSNLILNAQDALEEYETERENEIKVFIDQKDDEGKKFFIVQVIDNGPGIPEDQVAEIYEPFFSTKPTSGTGLGLGVVKRLVHLYGGQISVESKENEGTIFTITLPEDNNGQTNGTD